MKKTEEEIVSGKKKNKSKEKQKGNDRKQGLSSAGYGSGKKRVHVEPVQVNSEDLGGFVFVCNEETFEEDFRLGLFGLPARYIEPVKRIHQGMPLFLYNFSEHLLYGIYEATTSGGLNIDNTAFRSSGIDSNPSMKFSSKFPAQVRVDKDRSLLRESQFINGLRCLQVRFREKAKHKPLPEAVFRPYLQHYDGLKFDLQLTTKQAAEISKLFEGDRYAGPLSPHLESKWKQMKESLAKSNRKEGNAAFEKHHQDSNSDLRSKGRKASHGPNIRVKEKDTKSEERGAELENAGRHEAGERTIRRETQPNNSQRSSIPQFQSVAWNNQRSLADMLRKGKDNGAMRGKLPQNSKSGLDKDLQSDFSGVGGENRENAGDRESSNSNIKISEGSTLREDKRYSRTEVDGQMRESDVLNDSSNALSRENKSQQENQTNPSKIEDEDVPKSKRIDANGGDCQKKASNHDSTSKGKILDRSKTHSDFNGTERKAVDDKKNDVVKVNAWKTPFSAAHKLRTMHAEAGAHDSKKHDTGKFSKEMRPKGDNAVDMRFERGFLGQEPPRASSEKEHSRHSVDDNQVNGVVEGINGNSHETDSEDDDMSMAERARFLTREIEAYIKEIKPSKRIRRIVHRSVDLVRKSVTSLWSGADVELFGSFSTGLCLKHSDVDLAVINAPPAPSHPPNVLPCPPPEHSTLRGLIRSLAGYLRSEDWCKEIKTIDTAYMPVIKLRACPEDMLENENLSENKKEISDEETNFAVAIDITIMQRRCSSFPEGAVGPSVHFDRKDAHEMKKLFPVWKPGPPLATPSMYVHEHNGAMERDWIRSKLTQMPQLESLVLILKEYLHRRRLNSVYNGGIGSYALYLLVVFFIESQPGYHIAEAISPRVAAAAPVNKSTQTSFPSKSTVTEDVTKASVGQLLLGFLQLFGCEVDLQRVVISLRSIASLGGISPRPEVGSPSTGLRIIDPLREGMVVGNASYAIWQVQFAFREALECLLVPRKKNQIEPSILAKMFGTVIS